MPKFSEEALGSLFSTGGSCSSSCQPPWVAAEAPADLSVPRHVVPRGRGWPTTCWVDFLIPAPSHAPGRPTAFMFDWPNRILYFDPKPFGKRVKGFGTWLEQKLGGSKCPNWMPGSGAGFMGFGVKHGFCKKLKPPKRVWVESSEEWQGHGQGQGQGQQHRFHPPPPPPSSLTPPRPKPHPMPPPHLPPGATGGSPAPAPGFHPPMRAIAPRYAPRPSLTVEPPSEENELDKPYRGKEESFFEDEDDPYTSPPISPQAEGILKSTSKESIDADARAELASRMPNAKGQPPQVTGKAWPPPGGTAPPLPPGAGTRGPGSAENNYGWEPPPRNKPFDPGFMGGFPQSVANETAKNWEQQGEAVASAASAAGRALT